MLRRRLHMRHRDGIYCALKFVGFKSRCFAPVYISFSVEAGGQRAPTLVSVNLTFRKSRAIIRSAASEPGGPGRVFRACGSGSAPGKRFPTSVYPGELYVVAQTHSDYTAFMGVAPTPFVVRRNQGTLVRTWRLALVANCVAPGHLRAPR